MMPDKFAYLTSWFLRYKLLEGKKANNYYLKDYMAISRDDTVAVIQDNHLNWVRELKEKNFDFPEESA